MWAFGKDGVPRRYQNVIITNNIEPWTFLSTIGIKYV